MHAMRGHSTHFAAIVHDFRRVFGAWPVVIGVSSECHRYVIGVSSVASGVIGVRFACKFTGSSATMIIGKSSMIFR